MKCTTHGANWVNPLRFEIVGLYSWLQVFPDRSFTGFDSVFCVPVPEAQNFVFCDIWFPLFANCLEMIAVFATNAVS